MFLIKAHCRNILFSGLYLPGLSHVICSCWFCSVGPTANNQITYLVKTLPLPTTIFTNHDPFIETLDLWLIIELPNINDFIKKNRTEVPNTKIHLFFLLSKLIFLLMNFGSSLFASHRPPHDGPHRIRPVGSFPIRPVMLCPTPTSLV